MTAENCRRVLCVLGLGGSVLLGATPSAWAQAEPADVEIFVQPVPEPLPAGPGPDRPGPTVPARPAEAVEKPDAANGDEPAEPEPSGPAVPVNPRLIRLHLMDGSVISGELSVDEIIVDTEFGRLTVPVTSIRSLTPGLDSHPQLSGRVQELIEALASDDYKAREQAQKDLQAMGLPIRPILETHADDENAERKRRIAEILKQFAEIADQESAFDEEQESGGSDVWQKHDTVVTTRFTVAGKISPATFTVHSKYGPLTVRLADVKTASRELDSGSRSIRRAVSVSGENLVQRTFKTSGVTVQKGDKVSIVADGQIVMTPWGSNSFSGPEGAPNYGTYSGNIFTGALVAKIGSGGTVFKVGSRHAFTADRAGALQFAVAMNPSYASRGYNFPGQYNVKVRVDREK